MDAQEPKILASPEPPKTAKQILKEQVADLENQLHYARAAYYALEYATDEQAEDILKGFQILNRY